MQDGMDGSLSVVRTVGADQASGPGWNAASQVVHSPSQASDYPETVAITVKAASLGADGTLGVKVLQCVHYE